MKKLISLCFVLTFFISGCNSFQHKKADIDYPKPNNEADKVLTFTATEFAENPLIGHFWSPKEQKFLGWREALSDLPEGGWLMIGEQHNHPDHHSTETFFIRLLAHAGKLGNVIFEMVDIEQQSQFDQWLGNGSNASGHDLHWNPNKWNWMDYRDQVSFALDLAPRVLAGNISDSQVAKIMKGDIAVESHSTKHSELLINTIIQGHCNKISSTQAQPMVDVQIARDQFMASQMRENTSPGKINLLIAGAGHIRSDIGVSNWIDSDIKTKSIILQQVGESENPNSYMKSHINEQPVADLILFVPAIPSIDYCQHLSSLL
ncbi:putative lipoprotein [Nitrincola lacisaponensis]|uniref:Putative lipoprotein n=1 Tax=Nitrincola lacisaponensis TaxID=267850 RepID=A0A063XXK6_9GAMM|nr:ChaN family lipoprotein [Nitrincola lacisaponensis]KDE38898.1 putative lipoprotein [Nitrincola lacisaponensis]